MLDAGFNQALGLERAAGPAGLRVVPIAAHGAWDTDQSAMWELCAALHGLGWPVAVLDGTAVETPDNLGLADLLQGAAWDDGAPADAYAMSVLPAARGLRALQGEGHDLPGLHRLHDVLRGYRAVLLYAGATSLAPLLEDTGARPLVFMPPTQQALVTAYNSVKQLKVQAGADATLVTVLDGADSPGALAQVEKIQASVRNCALTHLGSAPHMATLQLGDASAVQRFALQLLENAISIGSNALPWPMPYAAAATTGARRH